MLSVCIITKNEEKNIGRCLEALSGYGFELVVADTGSVDKTREIAGEFTDKVYDFAWQDDFAAAKNFAVSKAAHDLVLVVDSDEFLDPLSESDIQSLGALASANPQAVGRVLIRNQFTQDEARQESREWVNRIFDRRKFHYKGRIHEQLVSFQDGGYETWLSPLSFLHIGYDLSPEERKQKTQRNIRLLEHELSAVTAELGELRQGGDSLQLRELEAQVPYLLYQLGKGWYMAHEYVRACAYFSQGLSHDLDPRLEYVIDMVETYGYALINSGQEQAALCFENIYEEFCGSADFLFLMGLIYMKNACFEAAVREFEKALQKPHCKTVGVNSFAANYNIGVIRECLGNLEEAREFYRKSGEYGPARERLEAMGVQPKG